MVLDTFEVALSLRYHPPLSSCHPRPLFYRLLQGHGFEAAMEVKSDRVPSLIFLLFRPWLLYQPCILVEHLIRIGYDLPLLVNLGDLLFQGALGHQVLLLNLFS